MFHQTSKNSNFVKSTIFSHRHKCCVISIRKYLSLLLRSLVTPFAPVVLDVTAHRHECWNVPFFVELLRCSKYAAAQVLEEQATAFIHSSATHHRHTPPHPCFSLLFCPSGFLILNVGVPASPATLQSWRETRTRTHTPVGERIKPLRCSFAQMTGDSALRREKPTNMSLLSPG